MSDSLNMRVGVAPSEGFSIKVMCRCRLVFGTVPVSEFEMLTHGFSAKAVMATDIADRLGATFVIGEPADLDELRRLDLPVSEKRDRDYRAAVALKLGAVAQWLRVGERGASSNAMCKRIFGVPNDAGANHPHDPADLRRCLLFLEAASAHDRVFLMADVSPEWCRLVTAWDQLVEKYREELCIGTSAPETYALMQQVIKGTGPR